MRFFITKRHLVWLIGVFVFTTVVLLFLVGCIPVTIRPQFDSQGKPIAVPVTPTGSISPDGTLNPIYPVSDESPKQTNWKAIGVTMSVILNALLAAYGINLRGAVSQLTSGLRITSDLADANARAETDKEVEQNKMIAFQQQVKAGVHQVVQKVRGKSNV